MVESDPSFGACRLRLDHPQIPCQDFCFRRPPWRKRGPNRSLADKKNYVARDFDIVHQTENRGMRE